MMGRHCCQEGRHPWLRHRLLKNTTFTFTMMLTGSVVEGKAALSTLAVHTDYGQFCFRDHFAHFSNVLFATNPSTKI